MSTFETNSHNNFRYLCPLSCRRSPSAAAQYWTTWLTDVVAVLRGWSVEKAERYWIRILCWLWETLIVSGGNMHQDSVRGLWIAWCILPQQLLVHNRANHSGNLLFVVDALVVNTAIAVVLALHHRHGRGSCKVAMHFGEQSLRGYRIGDCCQGDGCGAECSGALAMGSATRIWGRTNGNDISEVKCTRARTQNHSSILIHTNTADIALEKKKINA